MALHISSSSSTPYTLPSFPVANASRVAQTRAKRPDAALENRPGADGIEGRGRGERGERGERGRRAERGEAASFRGVRADYRSGEKAALEVKTEDGDTVSISFAALNRIQAGVYEAQAEGNAASAQSYSAQSSVEVSVKVEGTLDEDEVKQIGDLLDSLVTSARSESPGRPVDTSGFGELDSFEFAYKAYERVQVSSLEAQAG